MTKSLPDKYIRKAIYNAINNIVVDGKTIKCYDYRVTGKTIPDYYTIITTQTNQVIKSNKCENAWQSSVLIDVFTKYNGTGNTGSRLFADNILDAVKTATDNLTLDVASGLSIVWQTQSFPNDLVSLTKTENVFRKFLRIEFYIN